MIPFILTIVGGYLIGDSMKSQAFADGGSVMGQDGKQLNVGDLVSVSSKRNKQYRIKEINGKENIKVVYHDGSEYVTPAADLKKFVWVSDRMANGGQTGGQNDFMKLYNLVSERQRLKNSLHNASPERQKEILKKIDEVEAKIDQMNKSKGYADGGKTEDFSFKPYGKTKGKFKVTYMADGKKQSETVLSKEMAMDTAKRYKKIEEFSKIEIFDESGKKIMEEGGSIADSNNEMLRSKVKEVKHHADELGRVVKPKTKVEAWVVSKAERSASDLSDITHYLDGKK
jgi:hypothetical protein